MAGGRRPANYAASVRHNPGVERTGYDRPTSPTVLAPGHSLPLWPASIWQPSPSTDISTNRAISNSNPSPQQQPTVTAAPLTYEQPAVYPTQERASALAQVLECTIETAVARHFANTPSAPSNEFTSSPYDLVTSAPQTTNTISQMTSVPTTSTGLPSLNVNSVSFREHQLVDLVQRLEEKLEEKDNQLSEVNQRLELLEKLYQEQRQTNRQMFDRIEQEFRTKLDLIQKENAKAKDSWFAELQSQKVENENSLGKMKSAMKKSEQDKESNVKKKISDETRRISDHINSQMNEMKKRVEKNEGDCKQVEESFVEMQKLRKHEISEVRKNIHGIGNQTTTVQSQLKKIESQVANLSHRVMNANTDIGGMKNRVKEIESSVSSLTKQKEEQKDKNEEMYEAFEEKLELISTNVDAIRLEWDERDEKEMTLELDGDISKHLQSRIHTLESSTKGLKKLVETNLRAHGDAEEIVKKQVSLITKHVCVAMRQFTSRRIHENNILLDKALRARIPEYAKNQDRFVLVREEDSDGNDNVQVKRIVDVPAKAAS